MQWTLPKCRWEGTDPPPPPLEAPVPPPPPADAVEARPADGAFGGGVALAGAAFGTIVLEPLILEFRPARETLTPVSQGPVLCRPAVA